MNYFILIFVLLVISSCDNENNSEILENGELNSNFRYAEKKDTYINQSRKQNVVKELIDKGWKPNILSNGQLPICYNYKPIYGDVNNHLLVQVGGGTDVMVKVMNIDKNKCDRYVFVCRNSTYKIENIPEGKYFLKIAYGMDWFSRIESGNCIGKFIYNAMYECGNDTIDFNVHHLEDGYSIPSYSLRLNVVSSGTVNSFNSKVISEEDFND